MKKFFTLAIATTIALISFTHTTGAAEKLSLRVSPNVSNAPSTVIVTAIVARDPVNRWLHIEAESGEFYRSSDVELDGDKAPLVTEIRLNSLPGGNYAVTAVLKNNLGQETVVKRSAIVLSRFSEP